MIYFLTTKTFDYTVTKCLETEGRAMVGWVQPLCYGRLFLMRRFPPGTYIFADLEQLTAADLRRAEHVWNVLNADPRCRLLNHPTRTWRRYQLLRTLHKRGANSFNVYRLTERTTPERFPVFIRNENDHLGAQSKLLHSQAELEELITRIDRLRGRRRGRIITEYCDGSDAAGVHRKYAAFVIGERILPRHLLFSRNWCIKCWDLLDEPLLAEERRYMAENPHAEQLRAIFALAGVEFGRMDYGLVNGRIQVWEINTNPQLVVNWGGGGPCRDGLNAGFRDRLVEAMRAIDQRSAASDSQPVRGRPAVPLWAAAGIPLRKTWRRLRRPRRLRAA